MLDCVRSLSPAPGVSYSRLKSLAQESTVHPDSSISLTSPPAYFLTPEKMHEMRGRGISLKIPISAEQKLERTPDPEPVKVQGFRWGCWGGFGLHWASVAMLPLGTAPGHCSGPCPACACGGRAAGLQLSALAAAAGLHGCESQAALPLRGSLWLPDAWEVQSVPESPCL